MDISIDQLRSQGFRMTPQRLAILRILSQVGRHHTPKEVYELAAKEIPGITEATVYRTLSFLAAQGLALEAHVGNGQLVYESAEHNHHHLVCKICHGTCVVDNADLADVFCELEQKTGFQIDNRHVTFFGVCPDCRENLKEHATDHNKGDD